MARPARAPNTTPSSSELLARRFAPWTPFDATSPAANRRGMAVAPSRSVRDTAHGVVRRRGHRGGLLLQVHAVFEARLVDARETARHKALLTMRQVEKNVRRVRPPHLGPDGARHHVARRQFFERMAALQEPFSGRIAQISAFARAVPRRAGSAVRLPGGAPWGGTARIRYRRFRLRRGRPSPRHRP